MEVQPFAHRLVRDPMEVDPGDHTLGDTPAGLLGLLPVAPAQAEACCL